MATNSQIALKPKLLDKLREAIRTHYYSYRTGETYLQWLRKYIIFHMIASSPNLCHSLES